jgi:hypothetical protein
MRLNGFSQQTIHDWASAAGTAGPWNSSVSLLQRGRLDCKGQFWVAFGQLNKDLAEGTLNYVTDRKLKDKLKDAMPFLTEKDLPATATDFFSMFIGELQPAAIYTQPIAITDQDAESLTLKYREAFRSLALDRMITPKEAWSEIEPRCKALAMTAKQITKMREVLIGFSDYSADDLTELSNAPGEEPAPGKALHMAR